VSHYGLRGTEGLLETVGFKMTTKGMWWWTSENARREFELRKQWHWSHGRQTLCADPMNRQ